jgi:integrase
LTVGDYDPRDQTLLVRESKFHKSRLLPLSSDARRELEVYLLARRQRGFPLDPDSALIWNRSRRGGRPYTGEALRCGVDALFTTVDIRTATGARPRVHDLRHTFAVHALLRWYHRGVNPQAKLPFLSTYMGHVSPVSTAYYLPFVSALAEAASLRFLGTRRAVTETVAGDRPRAPPRSRHRPARYGPSSCSICPRSGEPVPHRAQLSRQPALCSARRGTHRPCCRAVDLALTPEVIIAFLNDGEQARRNRASTRNVRLAAIHAFFRFVASLHPEHLEQCQRVLAIPFKRSAARVIEYLEYPEIQAALLTIDRTTRDGRRDYALLATMFNTGARVQEILDLRPSDVQLVSPARAALREARAAVPYGRRRPSCPCTSASVSDAGLHALFRVIGAPLTRFGVLTSPNCDRPHHLSQSRRKRLHPQPAAPRGVIF